VNEEPLTAVIVFAPESLEDLAVRVASHVADRSLLATVWLDVEGAALHLCATPSAIRSMAQRGQIPVHRRQGRLLFDRRELDDWVRSGSDR
jgi:hypothetical protein